jgi:hypothetical protein
MRKFVILLILALSTSVFGQVNTTVNSRIRDASDPALVAAVGAASGTLAGTVVGLTTRSLIYNYIGTLWVPSVPPYAKIDDDATANCVSVTTATAQFTLPGSAGDWYCLSARGNGVCINCGVNPTADMTTNCPIFVPEGVTKCRRLTGPKCDVAGASDNGYFCFEHLNPAL